MRHLIKRPFEFKETEGINNYSLILYYLKKTIIKTHLDKISFGIYDESVYGIDKKKENLILNDLKKYFYSNIKVKEGYGKGSKYHLRRKVFENNGVNPLIIIGHTLKSNCSGYRTVPKMMITIHDPHREIVEWFDSVLNGFGYVTKMKQIEITVDFYDYTVPLQEFFYDHLFLSYCRSKPCFNKGKEPARGFEGEILLDSTFYIGHRNKNTKTIKIYRKEVNDHKILRLELLLNRQRIKALGLELPLERINYFDLTKVISFRALDRRKLLAYMTWKNRFKLEKKSELSCKCYIAYLNAWIFNLGDTLMEQVLNVKKSPYGGSNYSRFFPFMEEFNQAFSEKLENRDFLPSKKL